jgi:GGDEF domain-containing protein
MAHDPGSMLVDGLAATQLVDSSGETILIKGVDISAFETTDGIPLNLEHQQGKPPIGEVIYIKKLLTDADVENERQRFYWDAVRQMPCVYVICRLYDAAGNPDAIRIAAAIRDRHARGVPTMMRWSIEGHVISRDPADSSRITESVWRALAVTSKPCCKGAISGLYSDPNPPEGFEQVMTKTEPVPGGLRIGGDVVIAGDPLVDDDGTPGIRRAAAMLIAHVLKKSATAGGGDIAPSAEVGAEIQKDDLGDDDTAATVDAAAQENHGRLADLLSFAAPLAPRVFSVKLPYNGAVRHVGRFFMDDGVVHHLEDYFDLMGSAVPAGPADAATAARIQVWSGDAPEVAAHQAGDPDPTRPVVAESPTPPPEVAPDPPRLAPVFHYHRPGMAAPHVIEFGPTGPAIDGAAMDPEETALILRNVNDGLATLRYASDGLEPMGKSEDDLDKAILDPNAGYTFTARKPENDTERLARIDHIVSAHHNGEEVGRVNLRWRYDAHSPSRGAHAPGEMSVYNVNVLPDHRRKGVASAMYAHAEKVLGRKIVPSPLQSNAGRALWEGNAKNPQFGKAEVFFKAADPMDIDAAFRHLRAGVAAGHIDPEVERAFTSHVFTDPMTGIGNQYAYSKFAAQQRPGVYIGGDLNDLKHVNDTHGHEAGDTAIRATAAAYQHAAGKVGTVKSFRTGGDETVHYAPTLQDAAAFVRHASAHLDAHPPINGVHRVSVSFGLGSDPASADRALYAAKAGKKDALTGARAHAPGRVPNLAYSHVPGAEGPIQLHAESPPRHLVPAPTPPTASSPSAA